jgi:hypothetical protein
LKDSIFEVLNFESQQFWNFAKLNLLGDSIFEVLNFESQQSAVLEF